MIKTFRLQNTTGAYIEVCNYGASLVSVIVPDKKGNLGNVILSYKNVNDYLHDSFYLGSTVGRVANRISKAQFSLDRVVYSLDKNDGENSNHGGIHGFSKQMFETEEGDGEIVFTYLSKDGEGGFPGTLRLTVAYSFSDTNELSIEYRAVSDKKTVFNPTNHAYFNLAGCDVDILGHELKVYSDNYLESDNQFLPTGRVLPLEGTAFDFTEFTPFLQRMLQKEEEIGGYNTYFISNSEDELKLLASLRSEQSGRQVDVYSDMHGVQIYTGDYLSTPFKPCLGVAMEAQIYPDAPNHSHFPSCVIESGEEQGHFIKYHFKTY